MRKNDERKNRSTREWSFLTPPDSLFHNWRRTRKGDELDEGRNAKGRVRGSRNETIREEETLIGEGGSKLREKTYRSKQGGYHSEVFRGDSNQAKRNSSRKKNSGGERRKREVFGEWERKARMRLWCQTGLWDGMFLPAYKNRGKKTPRREIPIGEAGKQTPPITQGKPSELSKRIAVLQRPLQEGGESQKKKETIAGAVNS